MVKRIFSGFVGDDRLSLSEQEGVARRLTQVLADRGLLECYAEVPRVLGIDLETLGEGSEDAGFAIWLERLMTAGEPVADVLAMLAMASGVMTLWALADTAEETLAEMEEVFSEARGQRPEARGEEEEEDKEEALPELEDVFAAENVLVTAEGLKGERMKRYLDAVLEKFGPAAFWKLDEYRQWRDADAEMVKMIQEMLNGLPENAEEAVDEDAEDHQAWQRLLRQKFDDREVIFAAVERALTATGSIVFQVEGKGLLKAFGQDGLRATRSYLKTDEMDEQRDPYDKKRAKRAAKFMEALNSLLASAGG